MNNQDYETEIIGFSQTYQWYTGQPFYFPVKDITFKPGKDFLSTYNFAYNCQARFGFGGDITKWLDESFIGYEGHVSHNIHKEPNQIQRLIFNISGETRTLEEWVQDIEKVVVILLTKYTNLKELFLQPVIGGINEKSNIRAVRNQPYIVDAIKIVIGKKDNTLLREGAVIKLKDEEFSDMIGHLTTAGVQHAKELIIKYYNFKI
jgi:hypothetical protein